MSDGINRVTLTHIRIPLKEPDRSEIAEKEAIIVEIETSGGLTGLGECSATLDDVGTCWTDLTGRIIPAILGRTFTEIDAITAAIPDWHGCGRRALASVETALWDLVGQARKASIAALLGAEPEVAARGVDAGLSIGLYPTITDLLRVIERHLIEGYKQVKIEIAPGLDVDAVKAVRLHFGDELGLMVEANGLYSSTDIETLRVLDDFDLLMIEQPMAADDLDGLAMLQAAIATPVCIDESARSLKDVEAAINRRACKVVNLQLHRVGGYAQALAIHDLCLGRGVACRVGSTPEFGIGQAHGVQLATMRNCKYPTDLAPASRWFVDDCVVPAFELSGPGVFAVPDRPGLGYVVDPARLRRYEVRRSEFVAGTVT